MVDLMRTEARSGASRDQDLMQRTWASLRPMFFSVAMFSAAVNVLMLTGSVFMLQVYDRVLASRSGATLVALCVIAAALYIFLGLFDFYRTRVTSRAGWWVEGQLGPRLFKLWMARGATGVPEASRPLADLATVRQFLGSPGLAALFDAPWVPFYLGILFLIHWKLGVLALFGALFVTALAIATEFATRKPTRQAAALETMEQRFLEQSHRNAAVILPLGMMGAVSSHWRKVGGEAGLNSQKGAEAGEGYAATSKGFRLLLQSALLGLGAWLAILQEISPGMIIAGTIIGGRALAPVDQLIGQWRMIGRAREAYRRLSEYLAGIGTGEPRLQLPPPKQSLELRNVTKFVADHAGALPGGRRAILSQVSFRLEAGDGLGVIGPSASGKTSLARVMTGGWAVDGGSVRIDEAAIEHWDLELLGRHLGYLPQNVELLAGTIRQNISRFDPQAKDEEIIEAASIAGVHEMILRLPGGYDAPIGQGQTHLSGGQVQRIGLARALFRRPHIVVLDEPNAHLDADGDAALTSAIGQMRAIGSIVVVMAHRPSAITAVNKLLMLNNGTAVDFGDKSEVLRRVTRPAQPEGAQLAT
jgi:ATP-binding cassette, subfamily C, bacterial exporter for protease/lipase